MSGTWNKGRGYRSADEWNLCVSAVRTKDGSGVWKKHTSYRCDDSAIRTKDSGSRSVKNGAI